MLDLLTGVVQGFGKIIQLWVQIGAQSGEKMMLARFSVIVKQLSWEARSETLDEVALYPSRAKCNDGWSGVGQFETSGSCHENNRA